MSEDPLSIAKYDIDHHPDHTTHRLQRSEGPPAGPQRFTQKPRPMEQRGRISAQKVSVVVSLDVSQL
jgi:hypothetical protein